MSRFKKVFYALFMFLFIQGSITLHAQSDYPVGEKFGAVIKDQRVAKETLSSIRKDSEVQFENGIVANIIEEEDLSPTDLDQRKFSYSGDSKDFSVVSFEGLEFFEKFTNISVHNVVLDRFPTELLNSKDISRIMLSGNLNEDIPAISIPNEISELEKLHTLTLQFISLTEFPDFLHTMPNLKSLQFNYGNYHLKSDNFTIPDNIVDSKSLEDITLSFNNLKKVPDDLYKMSNLKRFNLYGNALEELSPENYRFLKTLDKTTLDYQRSARTLSLPLPLVSNFGKVQIEMPQILSMILTEEPENIPMSFTLEVLDKDTGNSNIINIGDSIDIKENKIVEIPTQYFDVNNDYSLIISVDNGLLENSKYKIDFNVSDFYTINYDANGGTGTMEPQKIYYDSEPMLKNNEFTREGYEFIGWSLDKDGSSLFTLGDPDFDLLPKDIVTLYAVWEETEAHNPKPENPKIDEPIVDEPGQSEVPSVDEPVVGTPNHPENSNTNESEEVTTNKPVNMAKKPEVPNYDKGVLNAPDTGISASYAPYILLILLGLLSMVSRTYFKIRKNNKVQ